MTTTSSPTIRIDKTGGAEEMRLVDLPVGEPNAGEVRIRHHAIGVNFLDVYQRAGVYSLRFAHARQRRLRRREAGGEASATPIRRSVPTQRAAGHLCAGRVLPRIRRAAARRDLRPVAAMM